MRNTARQAQQNRVGAVVRAIDQRSIGCIGLRTDLIGVFTLHEIEQKTAP
jgi:hypothetical protein